MSKDPENLVCRDWKQDFKPLNSTTSLPATCPVGFGPRGKQRWKRAFDTCRKNCFEAEGTWAIAITTGRQVLWKTVMLYSFWGRAWIFLALPCASSAFSFKIVWTEHSEDVFTVLILVMNNRSTMCVVHARMCVCRESTRMCSRSVHSVGHGIHSVPGTPV